MGASIGHGKGRVRPQVNVTPLVDVVLVLLIIFMVVTPLLTKQFWLHVPKPDEAPAEVPPADRPPLVLTVDASGEAAVNRQRCSDAELSDRLPRMFAARGDHVLVFDADARTPYARAVRVMDLARAAGAVTLVVSPRALP